MTCLLCGSEADQEEMHHLAFNFRSKKEFERQFPDEDLATALEDFGFCSDCMLLTKSERAAMVLVAKERMLDNITRRTLH